MQVRTVVQDAWAIIQHHRVYKRESEVPTQLQRKLNSLAGLFETVDDQFEHIREEREAYLSEVRGSATKPKAFLELNLDSFKEYLKWKFPARAVGAWHQQVNIILDKVLSADYKTLLDLDTAINATSAARAALVKGMGEDISKAEDGTVRSTVEAPLAVALTSPNFEKLGPWGEKVSPIIERYRTSRFAGRR